MIGDLQHIDGLGASLLAAAISSAGILAVATAGDFARRNSVYFSAFAVGLLSVSVSFHLILEALDQSIYALSWVAGGFTIMVLLGIVVQIAVGRREENVALSFGYATIIALAAHSFLDGVIYAIAFQKQPFTGWLTTGALLVHEFPEGVIAYFLLAKAGLSQIRSIILAFLAAAVTTVAGAIAASTMLTLAIDPPMAAMMGSAAGALIYVLIFHLGPHGAEAPGKRGYAFAQFGVIVATAAIILHTISR